MFQMFRRALCSNLDATQQIHYVMASCMASQGCRCYLRLHLKGSINDTSADALSSFVACPQLGACCVWCRAVI